MLQQRGDPDASQAGVDRELGNRDGFGDVPGFGVVVEGTGQAIQGLAPLEHGCVSPAHAEKESCGFAVHRLVLFGRQASLKVGQSVLMGVGC